MDALQPPSASTPAPSGGDVAVKRCPGSRRVSVRLTNGQVVNCDTRKVSFVGCACARGCMDQVDLIGKCIGFLSFELCLRHNYGFARIIGDTILATILAATLLMQQQTLGICQMR